MLDVHRYASDSVTAIIIGRPGGGYVHPQGREKNWGSNLQEEVVSVPPGRARVQIFEEVGSG